MQTIFTENVIEYIKNIPQGKISTYGKIAKDCGNIKGARQVSRILHSCSEKENLPWFRVVNSQGKISLKKGYGFELQKSILEKEGIVFDANNKINLNLNIWDF